MEPSIRTPVSSEATTSARRRAETARLATGLEAGLRTPEQVHQAALAEREPEQIRQGRLQPLVGEGLKGLEIGRHRMQPRAERRAASLLRHRRDDPRPAGTGSARPDADAASRPGPTAGNSIRSGTLTTSAGRSPGSAAAAGAAVGTMLDDLIGVVTHHPAVAFVARLGPAGLGLLPPLLAIGCGRLGGGARGLLRPLQPQHQLDQLFLAQTLKIAATHPALESAKTANLKGVGNYFYCTSIRLSKFGFLQTVSTSTVYGTGVILQFKPIYCALFCALYAFPRQKHGLKRSSCIQ